MQAAFSDTRAQLLEHPWAVDDLDPLLDRWTSKRYRKALLFVDNAGSDVVLGGAMPTAWLQIPVCLQGRQSPVTQANMNCMTTRTLPWESALPFQLACECTDAAFCIRFMLS